MSDIRLTPYLPIDWGSFMLGKWLQIMIFPIDFSYWNGYSVTAWVGQNPFTCFDFQKPCLNERGCACPGEECCSRVAATIRRREPCPWGPLGALLVDDEFIISWFESRDHERFMWGIKDNKSGYHRWWLVDDCTIVIFLMSDYIILYNILYIYIHLSG